MMEQHRQCSAIAALWESAVTPWKPNYRRCMLTHGHDLDRGHLMKDSNGQLFWAPDKVVDP